MCSVILDLKRPNYDELVKMMGIIYDFIAERKIIVGGGLAMHYALKLKGHPGIYDDRKLPDFDVFSKDCCKDSNDLAKLLYEKGYEKVDSINAIADNVRRVRFNYESFVDIWQTNIDQPSISYDKILISDPLFQRLVLYDMLSQPFGYELVELMVTRANKDSSRLKLMDQYYPLDVVVTPSQDMITSDIKLVPDAFASGLLAYALYYGLAESPYKDELVKVEYNNGQLLHPKDLPKRFAFYHYTSKYKNAHDKKIENYCKYLPKALVVGDNEIYNIKYMILSFHTINGIKVLHLYSLMVYFMVQYFLTKKEIYLQLVKSIQIMQKHSDSQPKYDISYEPCGDIHHNFVTQKYIYKKVVENRPYVRPENYKPSLLKN
jgi:Poly(A) polymerase catalytic subunit